MLRKFCGFDESYYAYYSDLENDEQGTSLASIYIGDNMGGKNRLGKLFVISGPSGVGKTTLTRELFVRLNLNYNVYPVITYTTKLPRKGEIPGIDYHYITEEEFKIKLSADFFIEHSKAYGSYYGSPKSIIQDLDTGKSFLLVVDQVGAYDIKKQYNEAVLIWITPPSIQELTSRLEKRATESNVDMQKRLIIAQNELDTEYKKGCFDYVVQNDIFERSVCNLINILKAEITSGSANC